jgi:hypothetical protein
MRWQALKVAATKARNPEGPYRKGTVAPAIAKRIKAVFVFARRFRSTFIIA